MLVTEISLCIININPSHTNIKSTLVIPIRCLWSGIKIHPISYRITLCLISDQYLNTVDEGEFDCKLESDMTLDWKWHFPDLFKFFWWLQAIQCQWILEQCSGVFYLWLLPAQADRWLPVIWQFASNSNHITPKSGSEQNRYRYEALLLHVLVDRNRLGFPTKDNATHRYCRMPPLRGLLSSVAWKWGHSFLVSC